MATAYQLDSLQNLTEVSLNASTLSGNPYGYTGRRYDTETGLWYYRNRMYSASLGRFLQRDPARFVDGYNIYAYVQNRPLIFFDPMGLADISNFNNPGFLENRKRPKINLIIYAPQSMLDRESLLKSLVLDMKRRAPNVHLKNDIQSNDFGVIAKGLGLGVVATVTGGLDNISYAMTLGSQKQWVTRQVVSWELVTNNSNKEIFRDSAAIQKGAVLGLIPVFKAPQLLLEIPSILTGAYKFMVFSTNIADTGRAIKDMRDHGVNVDNVTKAIGNITGASTKIIKGVNKLAANFNGMILKPPSSITTGNATGVGDQLLNSARTGKNIAENVNMLHTRSVLEIGKSESVANWLPNLFGPASVINKVNKGFSQGVNILNYYKNDGDSKLPIYNYPVDPSIGNYTHSPIGSPSSRVDTNHGNSNLGGGQSASFVRFTIR